MHAQVTISKHSFWFLVTVLSALLVSANESVAVQLQLSWTDNSTNETGFKIDRKTGTAGTYAQIASVGANVTSYSDSTLVAGTNYCYRLHAFNAAGKSAYTPQVCATPTAAIQAFTLVATKAGTGSGTMTSSPAGINCTTTCSKTFTSGTAVTLTATPAKGSVFAGWAGTGCAATAAVVKVTMTADRSCKATFNSNSQTAIQSTSQMTINPLTAKIGIFRPSTGQWFLDSNGNGIFDGCTLDRCVANYGNNAMLPVVADWYGGGRTNIGVFDSNTGSWHLDDGNGKWDACGSAGDLCVTTYGEPGSLPVVKEVDSEKLVVGTFQPQVTVRVRGKNVTKLGVWNFDLDGDGKLDRCSIDQCIENFGRPGDLPIVGDWNGTGREEIGFFRPQSGQWYLDLNGNGKWDGSTVDRLLGPFGLPADLPIVGDWDGTGKIRIGTFRPSTGEWVLDMNGNGKRDGCDIDACLEHFGQAGDLPVVGKW